MVIPALALMAGIASCDPCHRPVLDTYHRTAHFNSSARAAANSIHGSFSEGRNTLATGDPALRFKMEWLRDGFYQTAFDHGKARTERFEITMGSGRRGQSYIYRNKQKLYQMPVSYSRAAGGWVASPGYPEDKAYFDREIEPSCLGCHATFAEGKLLPGIQCSKCHGDSADHKQLRNPAGFNREAKIAVCSACHGGKESDPKAEVHGNQVALLRRSRCFQSSAEMTCGSCHNIHQVQRDLVAMSAGCAACHQRQTCKRAATVDNCIECHMPKRESVAIQFRREGKALAQTYRTHTIAVYK